MMGTGGRHTGRLQRAGGQAQLMRAWAVPGVAVSLCAPGAAER